MSQFAMCFLPAQTRVWNDLPYTVFDTEAFGGFMGAVIVRCFPEFVFQFSVAQVLVGFHLRKQFINNFVFPTWDCVAGFNNNDNYDTIKI